MAVAFAAPALADDEAKNAFKAMSDYLVAQKTLSATYDATLEVITTDLMKVGLASSGTLTAERPNKVHLTRTGGVADVELAYDGKTLTAYGKNVNLFAKKDVEGGTIDELIDGLRINFGLELPAADLLSSNPFDVMMSNVTSAQALGGGVIQGKVCNHLVFRTPDVDWQIWVADSDKPLPCRFTITSKKVVLAPSYTIEFHDWKTGADVVADGFQVKPGADAKEVTFEELQGLDEAPAGTGGDE
jgi:hypothetical protein